MSIPAFFKFPVEAVLHATPRFLMAATSLVLAMSVARGRIWPRDFVHARERESVLEATNRTISSQTEEMQSEIEKIRSLVFMPNVF